MKTNCVRVWSGSLKKASALLSAGILVCWPLLSQNDDDEEEIFELSPFTVDSSVGGYRVSQPNTRLGATVGGAQDIRHTRDLVSRGLIPSSTSLTPEGLFSEHDLPIGGEAKPGWLFDIASQATPFSSSAQPDVEILAQLGFVSGIDAATFKPAPLNLVAVIDKSGSMNGQPLNLVRKSLLQVLSQLGSDDQLSIVLYGSDTHVYLPPSRITQYNRSDIANAISAIQSQGSTYMEAGLQLGYQLAKETAASFEGNTRVMLFTDEQPNVGRTDAESFMSLARDASENGVGLTTVGVGVHFGAELAEKISSVRGGNLFFFDQEKSMVETFLKELDTMVLELAHDMTLTIAPAEGVTITGLYGIPGDLVSWQEDGSLSLEIATIFASRNKGAIYLGFGPSYRNETLANRRDPLAHASITYTQADNKTVRHSKLPISLTPESQRQEGIVKGAYLVDHYATLKLATSLYEAGKFQAAAHLAHSFSKKDLPIDDSNLRREKELISSLAKHLAIDCEQRGLAPFLPDQRNDQRSLIGEWVEIRQGLLQEEQSILRITKNATAQLFKSSEENPMLFVDESDYEANNRYIVFEDWGRSFRFKFKDGTLILKDGNHTTTYARRTSETATLSTPLIRSLQKEISGLPQGPFVTFSVE